MLMSKFVQGATRMVRAASLGDKLDVETAKLAVTAVISSSSLLVYMVGGFSHLNVPQLSLLQQKRRDDRTSLTHPHERTTTDCKDKIRHCCCHMSGKNSSNSRQELPLLHNMHNPKW